MNKEFAPYEIALALKELGFDESCIAFWDGYNGSSHLFFKLRIKYHWLLRLFNRSPEEVSEITQYELEYLEGDNSVLAPLYQQAFRWLYQKLGIEKGIMPLDTESQQLLLKELIDKVSSKHLLG